MYDFFFIPFPLIYRRKKEENKDNHAIDTQHRRHWVLINNAYSAKRNTVIPWSEIPFSPQPLSIARCLPLTRGWLGVKTAALIQRSDAL